MLPRFELEEGEHLEVELVQPPDYARHPNQLAGVTNRRFLFIRRKELSRHPYAVEYVPLDTWSSLEVRTSLALASMLGGLTMVVFGALIVYFRSTGEAETVPSYGLALVMLASGVTLAPGVKRAKVAVTVEGRRLRWKSGPLKLSQSRPALRALVALATARGIPVDGTAKDVLGDG